MVGSNYTVLIDFTNCKTIFVSADRNTEETNPLWFYELRAIPQWHHSPTKCGNLVIKPDWCLTDHAGTGVYIKFYSIL